MPKSSDRATLTIPKLEMPFLVRQVEGHLIFGPISRHVPYVYLVAGIAIVMVIIRFLTSRQSVGQFLVNSIDFLIFGFILWFASRMTYRQQAIIGWISMKLSFGLVAMMLAVFGAIGFQRSRADAWPNLLLGLIWVPGVEFIPKLVPHQRLVTLARVILSLPCIYYGVRSGHWYY